MIDNRQLTVQSKADPVQPPIITSMYNIELRNPRLPPPEFSVDMTLSQQYFLVYLELIYNYK